MKKKLVTLILLILGLNGYSQILSIEETVDYINNSFTKNSHPFSIELSKNGELTVNYYDYYSARIRKDTNPIIRSKAKMHWSEVNIQKDTYSSLSLRLKCINSNSRCINTSGKGQSSTAESSFSIFTEESYLSDKILNAFEFLLYELKLSNKYNRNDDDPFAPQNFNKDLYLISNNVNSDKIKLETYGGVYKVWVSIGGIKKQFILDSGASDVSISKESERELINLGIIKKEDYIEPALYMIADGSIIQCKRVIIPEIIIGKFKIKNVIASVNSTNSPLLLGKSFLDKFRKWSVDNYSNELHLEN
jgi:aspartyl protease family protein